ncbi:MAG: hypothetical protein ABFD49_03840 [Armatimonadota bacterium]|nr:hypothetical protein [bacterium]
MNRFHIVRGQISSVFATVLLIVLLSCTVESSISTPYNILTKRKNVQVWQGFGKWLMVTEDLTAGRTCYYCTHTGTTRLSLKDALEGDWIPLGSAIKWLMYVDSVDGLDRLMTHDVDNQAYSITKSSVLKQVGCGMTNTTCIFGEYRANLIGNVTPVDLYKLDVSSGAIEEFCMSNSEKSEFAHDGDLMVYVSEYASGLKGIYGHYFNGSGEFLIEECDAYEPSVCGSIVAWAERNGSGWNIIAKNISTGETRAIAYTTVDEPRPEAGRDTVFWEDSRNLASTGIDIYGYDWRTGEEFVVTTSAGNQTRLRVCDDLVTYVSGPTNYEILWGANIKSPSSIVDLTPKLISDSLVTLAWTAIGTTSNLAVSYEARVLDVQPINNGNWDQATTICTLTTSAQPGDTVSADVQWLAAGHHYIAVRARYADATYSGISNCVRIYVPAASSNTLNAEAGVYLGFEGIVTGISPDMGFYLKQNSGMLAVRVIPSEDQSRPAVGDIVIATGSHNQDDDFFGPILRSACVTIRDETSTVRPIAMANKSLGGSIASLPGASNVWLPVKIWGQVSGLTIGNGCSFVISDGSTNEGVHVICPFDPPDELTNGCWACVEGICKVSRDNGRQVEVVADGKIEVKS